MVEVRYFASVAEAAGIPSETLPYEDGMTAGQLRTQLKETRPGEFSRLMGISALLVNGVSADDITVLPTGARIDVLPRLRAGD